MEEHAFPELYCPFPSALSPHAEAVHEATTEWARRIGLASKRSVLRRIEAGKLGFLAGRFHPEAPREELQLVSDLYLWMFLRDDRCDESELGEDPELLARTDSRFLEILGGAQPRAGEDPLGCALHDLRRRVVSKAPSALWLRRFVRAIRAHFDSTLWETANRAEGTTPDLATYVRMRPVTGGMHVDASLIEMIHEMVLAPDVLEHPAVRDLTRASNNVVCWANDLFSLEKELKSGDVHNLVVVLSHAQGLTLPEAVERATEMHDAEVRGFLEAESRLPSFGAAVDVNLARYLAGLRARMRGNLDWSLESGRYSGRAVQQLVYAVADPAQ